MVERAKSKYDVSHFGGFGRNGNGDRHDLDGLLLA